MTRAGTAQLLQLAAVLAAAAGLYLAHSLLRFRNFEARGYDLGIFDQAVRQYSRFEAPYVPIKGEGFHILGDHFHPIIALLAPLYWVWDDPRVLNLALIALLISAVPPVYLIIRGWFGHMSALLASVAMLLWWPFQAFLNWDFHEIAFGVPVLAWVLWAVERRRSWLAVGLGSLLLLVREDMGATLVAVGLVLALRRHWAPAAAAVVLGAAGLWFAVSVAIPHFAADGEFSYWEYTALGAGASAAAVVLVTQPWSVLPVLVDHPLKIALLTAHFLPLWLLPLVSPYVLIGLPILVSRLLNDRLTVWGLVYQYDAILVPVFLIAAFDVLRRIRDARKGTHVPCTERTWRRRMVRPEVLLPSGMIGLSLAGGAVLSVTVDDEYQIFPLHRTYTGDNWTLDERAEAHQRAVEAVPDGACVEAADTVAPRLTGKSYVGLAGTLEEGRVDWLIIDAHSDELGGNDPMTPEEAFARAERLGFAPVISDDHGLWTLSRDVPADPHCAEYVDTAPQEEGGSR